MRRDLAVAGARPGPRPGDGLIPVGGLVPAGGLVRADGLAPADATGARRLAEEGP